MSFKEKLRRRAMSNITPSETEVGQHLVNILATTEYQLFGALDRLVDAADPVEGDLQVSETLAERRDRLLAVADAVAAKEFEEWWWTEVAPEHLDNADTARECVGLSKTEWQAKMTEWAEMYRDAGVDVGEKTDAQIAALHVRESFDVDFATFAEDVVEWNAAEHVEGIVRQNLRVSTQTIHDVASALEDSDERVEA